MQEQEGGTHASEGMPCSSFSQAKKLLKTQDAVWSFGAQSGSKIMMMTPPNTRPMAANTANCWMRFAGTELTSPAASKQTACSTTTLKNCGQYSLGHGVAPSHAEHKPLGQHCCCVRSTYVSTMLLDKHGRVILGAHLHNPGTSLHLRRCGHWPASTSLPDASL